MEGCTNQDRFGAAVAGRRVAVCPFHLQPGLSGIARSRRVVQVSDHTVEAVGSELIAESPTFKPMVEASASSGRGKSISPVMTA